MSGYSVLAATVVGGAALRLFGLTRQGFWTDELYVVYEARQPLPVLFDPHLHIHHPPGYRFLLHLWLWPGLDELWIRLLPALAGVLLIPVVWLLARTLWPSHSWGANLSALLIATSPFLLHYSQDVTAYSWTGLWVATSMLLLVRAWRTDRVWLWAAWGASLAAAMYSHYFSLFPLMIEGAGVLVAGIMGGPSSRGKLLRAVIAMLGAALLFAPWVWVLLTYGRDALGMVTFPLSVDQQLASWVPVLLVGYARPDFWVFGLGFKLAWTLIALACLWSIWPLRRRDKRGDRAGAVLVAGWGVVAMICPYLFLRWTTPPDVVDPVRFAALAAPALMLGLGTWIASLPTAARIVALGLWLILAAAQWQAELSLPPKQDWRGVMATVASQAAPGDVLLAFPAFHAGAAAAYYPVPLDVQGGWFVPGCGDVRSDSAAYWFRQEWRWRGFFDRSATCTFDVRGELEKRTVGVERIWYLAGDGADGTYPPGPAAERALEDMGWWQVQQWSASPLVLHLYARNED
ncbi:MAG: glycosyltransferase family 39 protein [Chloroflexota bacterium]|nr:glycosyltransferase family 39 protein [Chloroflexota bacterium]MDQ5866176.1 glycosyltransferase family 39 protein [Chloroflexota bacterium]